ncbi:TetR/AcrR family transcriptional regulator [Brevibacterium sp. JSBI002]|uniref:TetR/AcrR family transcriptional regulator n=1 Tax=Brevibacterium sp. JSBI002 TaxID=2886045 RepID=UPI00222F19EF|nr:TetR/AcrR family transcriptional regulator [Brevibacterium sp. JSBI002]UZD61590.1 TetR family transcriptional regulator C-terminal domain-containing protein [Brevibacterium sp. JSBI002]
MVTKSNGADSTLASLADRVRDAIQSAGINHSEIARQIGLDASKLSKSLAGVRKFRVEEISRIAELTEVSTDWLTTGRTAGPPRRGRSAPTSGIVPVSDSPADDDIPTIPGQNDTVKPRTVAPTQDWMSKGTRSRVTIIAAAWELYADLGIAKVRTDDVARASGMTASAVNYHFRTKDQLLQAALRHSLDVIAETRHLNDSADPIGVLRHFARIHAGVDPKIRRVWSIWLQCWARAATDESARANLTAVYGEWMDMITTVIDGGQRMGKIREGNIPLMVKSLSIFIDGLGVARTTEHMPITDDEALTMLENYLAAHILNNDASTDDTRHPKSDRLAAAGRPESTS